MKKPALSGITAIWQRHDVFRIMLADITRSFGSWQHMSQELKHPNVVEYCPRIIMLQLLHLSIA